MTHVDRANCTEGDARLVNGPSASKGRLEVCIDHTWATVCSSFFGVQEGGVVCEQLGYQRYAGVGFFSIGVTVIDFYKHI